MRYIVRYFVNRVPDVYDLCSLVVYCSLGRIVVLFCVQFYLKSRLNCLLFTSKARPLHTLDGDDAMMEIPATLPVICSYFQFLFSWLALLGLLQLGHMFTDRCLFQYIKFYHSSSSLCGFFCPHCVFFFSLYCVFLLGYLC